MHPPDEHESAAEKELRRELDEQEHVDTEIAEELRTGERREGELAEELRELEERDHIEAEVVFPLAANSPFEERVSPEDTARQVLTAAMSYFAVKDDAATKYELYLSGQQVEALDERLGHLAEGAHEIKFTLSATLVNG